MVVVVVVVGGGGGGVVIWAAMLSVGRRFLDMLVWVSGASVRGHDGCWCLGVEICRFR